MELKILNEETIDFPESYGITPERQKELSRCLDEMVLSYGDELKMVKTAELIRDIAAFCNDDPEFAYCIILHMGWHQRRGMILAPRGSAVMVGKTKKYVLGLEQLAELWFAGKARGKFDAASTDDDPLRKPTSRPYRTYRPGCRAKD